ncbi:MAG TPA: tagaturonate epimerase family protein, partial [Phycisphaerae bacterium]|nr:tagaturonate epimerase family protein [Phycisphaerae bacterium]
MAAGFPGRIGNLEVYPASVSDAGGATYFIARRGAEKLVACVGEGKIVGEEVDMRNRKRMPDRKRVVAGAMDGPNAAAIRSELRWTRPELIGLRTSIGLGDRLGLATPGHIRAVRGTGLAAVLAQQSIREMTRTNRTPQEVMDSATWGALQEGFRDGFGADADHLQQPEDIDACAAAGFTMFTIDPGRHVRNDADTLSASEIKTECDSLDWNPLAVSQDDLTRSYVGKRVALHGGGDISLDELAFLRAAVKYGKAIAHTAKMHRHLRQTVSRPFELEVSVDETETPTSPAEHYFIAAELRRLGVEFVSLAPRFVGRFEKG